MLSFLWPDFFLQRKLDISLSFRRKTTQKKYIDTRKMHLHFMEQNAFGVDPFLTEKGLFQVADLFEL